jgi:ribosomal protein S12 methylthiotransferase
VQADLGVGATHRGRRVPTARKLLLSEPGSAYLRIAEGCGRRCGFCAIPGIKGALVSETIDRVVADARWLSERFGVREINLVAQDLASFGTDRGPNEIFDLLRALDDQTDVRWFRLLYVYPLSLNRAVLEFIGSSRRFARYLDVPFQHADSDVLKAMRRGGGSLVAYLRHVRSIRRAIPGVALRTTLLVGHPGETERRFETLLEFIREAHFEWMGVFPYSREEDTPSARLSGRVPAPVSERRAVEAMDAFREARSLDSFRLGEVRDALVVEGASDGFLACRTETEAPEVDGQLYVPVKPGVRPGQMVRVRVDEAMDMDFKGELVDRGVGHGAIRTTVMGGVTVVPERRAR